MDSLRHKQERKELAATQSKPVAQSAEEALATQSTKTPKKD